MRPLIVHTLADFTACNWDHLGKVDGVAARLPADAMGYVGLWDTRARWIWAVAMALRAYEGATGEAYPADGLLLCPVKCAELRTFKLALSARWQDEATGALSGHIAALVAGGMLVRIAPATAADLRVLLREGERAATVEMAGRVSAGTGVAGLLVR